MAGNCDNFRCRAVVFITGTCTYRRAYPCCCCCHSHLDKCASLGFIYPQGWRMKQSLFPYTGFLHFAIILNSKCTVALQHVLARTAVQTSSSPLSLCVSSGQQQYSYSTSVERRKTTGFILQSLWTAFRCDAYLYVCTRFEAPHTYSCSLYHRSIQDNQEDRATWNLEQRRSGRTKWTETTSLTSTLLFFSSSDHLLYLKNSEAPAVSLGIFFFLPSMVLQQPQYPHVTTQ